MSKFNHTAVEGPLVNESNPLDKTVMYIAVGRNGRDEDWVPASGVAHVADRNDLQGRKDALKDATDDAANASKF